MNLPVALTIAGSDSGGGAGIQADLKTFTALGVYGTCAITAITAQNTTIVSEVFEVPGAVVKAQIDRVAEDMEVRAVKTGMLPNAEVVRWVAGSIRRHGLSNLVVDPVMSATSGARLIEAEAVSFISTLLLPLATVVTPNIPEAEALVGRRIRTLADRHAAARALAAMGARAVVLTGGHAAGEAVDVLFDGESAHELRGDRIETSNSHGSGCTFAAAIAAHLALGTSVVEAATKAKAFVEEAIRNSLEIGRGSGPVNPGFRPGR